MEKDFPLGQTKDKLVNKPKYAIDEEEKDLTEGSKLSQELFEQILFSPVNSAEMRGSLYTPDETKLREKEMEELTHRSVVISPGAIEDYKNKYKEDIIGRAKKNPHDYEVMTPEGWMRLSEALDKGWDPATGEFALDPIENNTDQYMEELDYDEQEKLKQMTDPANIDLLPEQAEEAGIESERMMKGYDGGYTAQPAPEPEAPPEGDPLAAIMGGAM